MTLARAGKFATFAHATKQEAYGYQREQHPAPRRRPPHL
jgi:hypothetical protein